MIFMTLSKSMVIHKKNITLNSTIQFRKQIVRNAIHAFHAKPQTTLTYNEIT